MLDSWSLHNHFLDLSFSSDASSSHSRSSHLSILTSTSSSSSDAQIPSPLPSPAHSNASGSNKTNAFFGSPFADSLSPPPPPKGPSRASSTRSLRSRNADFFGAPSIESQPTPPPSLRSLHPSPVASPGTSPPSSSPLSHANMLPPMARFFPSRQRYATIDGLPSLESSTHTRRDFLDLEAQSSTQVVNTSSPVETPSTPPPTAFGPSSLPTPLPSTPVPRSEPQNPTTPLDTGDLIGDSTLTLEMLRTLGQGAFSRVWLAKDAKNQLGALELSRKRSLIRSRSLKRGRSKRMEGTVPKTKARKMCVDSTEESKDSKEGRLVAVKMTDRALYDKNDRTRVSFVREVEVLRHISHPSIVSYLHSFSTPSHHCLVLERVGGGDLFDLIDSTERHAQLDERLVRRMFGELSKAVGWMHGVGLVHRDIKLENILLTAEPNLDHHTPLIKLTDFGLSRFIDPSSPLLTTRCGSESYAAPELVTGRPYDGRETDVWACGIVLYAMATRRLPFDRERGCKDGEHDKKERKALLMRIAKGEYDWPSLSTTTTTTLEVSGNSQANGNSGSSQEQEQEPLRGIKLSTSDGLRGIVGRLLVRDPRKRTKIIDLWEDEWMRGDGAPIPPPPSTPQDEGTPLDTKDKESGSDSDLGLPEDIFSHDYVHQQSSSSSLEEEGERNHGGHTAIRTDVYSDCIDAFDADGFEDEYVDDGVLVDGDDIGPGSVARQEH